MKNKTIWLESIKFDKVNKLEENKNVDVLIIGGGMTGLSTAYHLINSNLDVCLVEKNLIAHGVSSMTTGKLTFLQENIYSKLKDRAYKYYNSQKEAINIVESIINENNIDCDYRKIDSYIYTVQEEEIKKIKKEEQMLKKLDIQYEKNEKLPIDLKCNYALKVNDTAVFHPIKYLTKLKKIIVKNGIEVYENSCVTSIKKYDNQYICEVNNKIIKAKKVVIASHYPFFLFPLLVPLKTYIEKSYISASLIDKSKDFSAITVSKPVKSIRYHKDNYFIYLTGTHNLCSKYNYKNNFDNLLNDLTKLGLKPQYIWSNHDIMTEDNLPYIGYIDDNLLIGTGYNTWGMTNGSIAGKLISDLIQNKESEYKDLFDPKRNKQLKNIIKYPLYMSYNVKSFAFNKINKNKSWYDNVKFTTKNGKSVAVYTNENKKEHIVYNICPHLKCSLLFNEVEKTWDCPCHGSRFDIDGNCICGPSNYNIKFNK